ncbi:hypothetical protein H1R20_g11256, partial [Candolleomyces eurysporus]
MLTPPPMPSSHPRHHYTLTGAVDKPFKFKASCSDDHGQNTFQPLHKDRASVKVVVDPKSNLLQHLQPFEPWSAAPTDFRILIKVKGSIEHISAGGAV